MLQIDRGPDTCYCDGISHRCCLRLGAAGLAGLGPLHRLRSRADSIAFRGVANLNFVPTSAQVRAMVPPETWQASRLSAVEGCGGEVATRELGLSFGAGHLAKCRVMAWLKERVRRLQDE
jgi:hypothetical protein